MAGSDNQAADGSSPSPLRGVAGDSRFVRGTNRPPQRVGERGRSTAQRASALRNAKHMRSEPTDTEHRLWQILRAKRLDGWKFRRQALVGPYTPDFICHGAKLIVEADGGHHSPDKDGERDEWLRSQGFRILRFWDNEIFTNEEGVLTIILSALEASATASSRDGRTPLPNPSPTRGEGLQEVPPWLTPTT